MVKILLAAIRCITKIGRFNYGNIILVLTIKNEYNLLLTLNYK